MRLIQMTDGQHFVVDDDDYDRLRLLIWTNYGGYPIRFDSETRKTIYAAREILEFHGFDLTDLDSEHIDRNQLNNQKSNLRSATRQQNLWNRGKFKNNTSGFTGVYQLDENEWEVLLQHNYERFYVGYFVDKIKAAEAYDIAILKLRGDFARLNFPKKKEQYELLISNNPPFWMERLNEFIDKWTVKPELKKTKKLPPNKVSAEKLERWAKQSLTTTWREEYFEKEE